VDHVRISVVSDGEVDLVHIDGVLDLATTPRLRSTLLSLVDGGSRQVAVDLARVGLIDCTAVGALVSAQARIQRKGGWLRVVGARRMVLEILEITGVAQVLGVYEEEVSEGPAGVDPVGTILRMMAQLPEDAPERPLLRNEAIEVSLPYATGLARRFRDRGEPLDDLNQVATIGLVKAVDGFDPSHGSEFTAYATPTIVGEIRRYFRDRGWRVRVPRRLQELRLAVIRAEGELSQLIGGSPTPADYARHLDVTEDDVLEALEAGRGYRPASLSAPVAPDSDAVLGDPIGDLDPHMEEVEARETLRVILVRLPLRERRILTLRFYGNRTQAEIAAELGISQMHVSRLLANALRRLRESLQD